MMIRPSLPPLAKGLAFGLVAVAVIAGLALLFNRGSQVRLEGAIMKVRTISTDDNASIAVVDFRIKNPARVLFLVKEVTIAVVTADGKTVEGISVAQTDLDRVLEYYKLTGPRFNPVLRAREKLTGGIEVDRTSAASFDIPEKALLARRNLLLRIQDADGVIVEIPEKTAR